jgi:hypothetical protein
MPHYADGHEARIGDIVFGTTYNRNGAVILGTVISVTPGSSCNLVVAFVKTVVIPGKLLDMYWYEAKKMLDTSIMFPNPGGTQTVIRPDYDYGETKSFTLVRRP